MGIDVRVKLLSLWRQLSHQELVSSKVDVVSLPEKKNPPDQEGRLGDKPGFQEWIDEITSVLSERRRSPKDDRDSSESGNVSKKSSSTNVNSE
jgi:hypothetical protein